MITKILTFVIALILIGALSGWVAITLSNYVVAYVHGIELNIADQWR